MGEIKCEILCDEVPKAAEVWALTLDFVLVLLLCVSPARNLHDIDVNRLLRVDVFNGSVNIPVLIMMVFLDNFQNVTLDFLRFLN